MTPAVPSIAHPFADAPDPLAAAFALDVAAGFSRVPKTIPPRWLYDDLGSALFEAICRLPWYRITRAERALLASHGRAILDAVPGPIEIVELGGGNGEKLDCLLDAGRDTSDIRVRLVDISQAALDTARDRLLSRDAPPPIELTRASYDLALSSLPPTPHSRLVVFLGSNIGNFDPDEAEALLHAMAAAASGRGAILLGVDLVKPERDLLLAYDDPLGVTAAFNRNLLARMNRDLGANVPLDAFAHRAIWNADASRVEMHLVAGRDVEFVIPAAAVRTRMARGEYIWTESSYKYSRTGIESLARETGLRIDRQWIDPLAGFALSLLKARTTESFDGAPRSALRGGAARRAGARRRRGHEPAREA